MDRLPGQAKPWGKALVDVAQRQLNHVRECSLVGWPNRITQSKKPYSGRASRRWLKESQSRVSKSW